MDQAVTEQEIIRVITGDCSWQEREKVAEWIKQNPENKEKFKKLRKTWDLAYHLDLQQNEDKAWQNLSERISSSNHLKIYRLKNTRQPKEQPEQHSDKLYSHTRYTSYQAWIFRAAAVCLLILGVLYVIYNYTPEHIKQEMPLTSVIKELKAKRGERLNLTLNDGTTVVLNSGSVLRYPSKFGDSTREIELEGEAFFSVARNKYKPFLVHTGKASVQVLGTKFNVNAYTENEEAEVVVAEGKVAVKSALSSKDLDSVSSSDTANEVILMQGEYTSVRKGALPTTPVKAASLDYHLGWVDGNLVFDATPLEEVIHRLELYYNRDFQVTNSMLLDRKFTATFKKESLSKVLNVLSIAMDVKYEQVDSLIYLEPYSPTVQDDYSNK